MAELLFPIVVEYPVCVEGMTEDAIRELAKALRAKALTDILQGFVQAPAAARVTFAFDSNGNFVGVTAIINGKPTTLINGLGSEELGLFRGPPTATNPGPGWIIEPELSKAWLHVTGDENTWTGFVASRVEILNTVVES